MGEEEEEEEEERQLARKAGATSDGERNESKRGIRGKTRRVKNRLEGKRRNRARRDGGMDESLRYVTLGYRCVCVCVCVRAT